jgi:putative transposase
MRPADGDLPPINESRWNVRITFYLASKGGSQMKKKHTAEQIVGKLREAELELAKGLTIAAVVRKLGITEQTYYRWRKEYGGLRTDQARRLKELERENGRLKKLVADLSLDNAILKEAAYPNS